MRVGSSLWLFASMLRLVSTSPSALGVPRLRRTTSLLNVADARQPCQGLQYTITEKQYRKVKLQYANEDQRVQPFGRCDTEKVQRYRHEPQTFQHIHTSGSSCTDVRPVANEAYEVQSYVCIFSKLPNSQCIVQLVTRLRHRLLNSLMRGWLHWASLTHR